MKNKIIEAIVRDVMTPNDNLESSIHIEVLRSDGRDVDQGLIMIMQNVKRQFCRRWYWRL